MSVYVRRVHVVNTHTYVKSDQTNWFDGSSIPLKEKYFFSLNTSF